MPFESGLSGADLEPKPLNPRGYELLVGIRERAEEDIRTLAPLIVQRFDGVERIEPDPDDIRSHELACATKRLIDVIVSDAGLAAPIAARLANMPAGAVGGGRTR